MPVNQQNQTPIVPNRPIQYAGRPVAGTAAPVQMQAQPVQQTTQSSSGLIWVQGYEAAKAWPVAPGNTVPLFDSESQTFYIKSVDVNGFPQRLMVYKYEDVTDKYESSNSNQTGVEGLVTVDMLDDILDSKFNEFFEKMNKNQNRQNNNYNKPKKTYKTRRYEEEDDE